LGENPGRVLEIKKIGKVKSGRQRLWGSSTHEVLFGRGKSGIKRLAECAKEKQGGQGRQKVTYDLMRQQCKIQESRG